MSTKLDGGDQQNERTDEEESFDVETLPALSSEEVNDPTSLPSVATTAAIPTSSSPLTRRPTRTPRIRRTRPPRTTNNETTVKPLPVTTTSKPTTTEIASDAPTTSMPHFESTFIPTISPIPLEEALATPNKTWKETIAVPLETPSTTLLTPPPTVEISAAFGYSNNFPLSAILALVAGSIAVLVTILVVAYYRRRYRHLSLTYLRNMRHATWEYGVSEGEETAEPSTAPPRSPSMSQWPTPQRPYSNFSWNKTSPALTDYSIRRARLSSLQADIHREIGGFHNNSATSYDNRSQHHLSSQYPFDIVDNQRPSYSSVDGGNSAISFRSSEPSTPRPTRTKHQLSMSSWDENA